MRDYQAAVAGLNSTQTNAQILEAVRKSGNALNLRSIPEMQEFLKRLGYKPSDLNRLNLIHIAGTKGKGSTSSFCESILRRATIVEGNGMRQPVKTGLFTSPHLVEARERIRVNGAPISRQEFADSFFHVWDKFEVLTDEFKTNDKPGYFRYLFLMAVHVFMTSKVDVAIFECGVGGEYDATNVLDKPVVSAITSLGFDHQSLLGHTIGEIAWHKAGIMKPGVPAITSPQPEDAIKVLIERSLERKVLAISHIPTKNATATTISPANPAAARIHILTSSDITALHSIKLGLAGEHQYINASVAVTACKEWAHRVVAAANIDGWRAVECDDAVVRKGLELASWPGRAQTFVKESEYPGASWYLDGAHTPESLAVCADWFKDVASGREGKNYLIFNCTGGRDPKELLQSLATIHKAATPFTKVYFCTNDVLSRSNADAINNTVAKDPSLKVQGNNLTAWTELTGDSSTIVVCKSIDDAVAGVMTESKAPSSSRVLVTGSLHLIGGFLTFMDAEVV